MSYAGLDLSRKRLGFHLLDAEDGIRRALGSALPLGDDAFEDERDDPGGGVVR
jgi:hypothetical protein